MAAEVQETGAKYHNKYLFNYCREEVMTCLVRLRKQTGFYWEADPLSQAKMRVRGLYTAALTLNATAVWTAKLLQRGKVSMVTQVRFFQKRWRLDPADWGTNAKSCFARALSGYSIGRDGVCIDRHLERMKSAPRNAEAQWEEWFRLYESLYGPGETALCTRWHVDLLDWIALRRREKPMSWK